MVYSWWVVRVKNATTTTIKKTLLYSQMAKKRSLETRYSGAFPAYADKSWCAVSETRQSTPNPPALWNSAPHNTQYTC